MLAAYTETEKQNTTFTLMGAKSILSSARGGNAETNAISILNSEVSVDTCSFASIFSEPSYSELMTFAESAESCGSVAYNGCESCGSIAYSGGESCGSVASTGGFSSSVSSSCGSACSYSC